jgi:integrase
MVHSTRKKAICKPPKPYTDFPLFAHATKRWAKKIKGKLYYFGPWDDPSGALEKFKAQREALYSRVTPRLTPGELTIRHLVNTFLTAKKARTESGELTIRSWKDYHATCERIVQFFGRQRLVEDIGPRDFDSFRSKLAKLWGPTTLGNEIRRVRVIFNFAFKHDLLDRPVKFGEFTPPSRKVMRLNRAKKGPRMFEADELRKIIDAAGVQLRAMIYLGINAGFGNADCARLPRKALDHKKGWISLARSKTGISRKAPLWPETVKALRDALHNRPTPKNKADKGLVFITRCGGPWGHCILKAIDKKTGKPEISLDDPIAKEFSKLVRALKLHRSGLGFYALRHGFETIAGESRDQPAVDFIMGHIPGVNDMGAVYRERISDERLKAVVDHVHKWLFETEKKQ